MKYNFLILFLLCIPVLTTAQEKQLLSISELFRLGTENSLRLKESHIRGSIASEQIKDAKTDQLPDIHVGATAGYIGQSVMFRQGLTRPMRPDMPNWNQNYNAELTQPLYQGGKIRYNIERASLEQRIAALNITNDEAEIKMLLLRQYMDLLSLYKQEEVFARNIEESDRRLADIRRMKKEGIVTRNDEIRSELELTNDQLAYQEAQNNIIIVSQHLDIVLGLDETLLLQPDTTSLSTYDPLMDCEAYIQLAYDNYPGLNIAKENTALARNDLRIIKAEYLPSVSARVSNTLARPLSYSMEDMFSNNWNVVLSLSFNLSSLYHNRHKVQNARYSISMRENREQQVMQEIRIDVRSAYIRHHEALDRIGSLTMAVRQAEENYRIVRNRYMNQLSILTDLLDASNIRLMAELQLTTARTQAVYTYYQLLRACGNL